MNQITPILLVEDNPDDEALTIRTLRRSGVTNEIVVARDGSEALDYLFGTNPGDSAPYLPVLIVLDMNLPQVSGPEVLRRLRADDRTRHLPVVALSGSPDRLRMVPHEDLGISCSLRKPLDATELAACLARLGLAGLLGHHPRDTGGM